MFSHGARTNYSLFKTRDYLCNVELCRQQSSVAMALWALNLLGVLAITATGVADGYDAFEGKALKNWNVGSEENAGRDMSWYGAEDYEDTAIEGTLLTIKQPHRLWSIWHVDLISGIFQVSPDIQARMICSKANKGG